ncbi:MAG: metallophosphoesterase [Oscillospiraceae bacterium]|nr:metallophosphoesterase [Oscillospiraceae bacterium]
MPTVIFYAAAGLAAILFIGILAAVVRAFTEPYLLDVDRTALPVPDPMTGDGPGQTSTRSSPDPMTGGGPGQTSTRYSEKKPLLRIVFFSDLHGKGCKVPLGKLLDALFDEPSDLIVFGGDIADSAHDAEDGLRLLRMIAQKASLLGTPCFAIRGNHDRRVPRERIESTGFRLLLNEHTVISGASGIRFLLIGLDDSGKKRRIWPHLPDSMPADIPKERRLLLVHNPDYILSRTSPADFGMMLSGHFHGGQVVLPFNLHAILRGDQLPRQGISKGSFSKNGINGYISRGVGCVTLPIRFLAKPQISYLSIVD